MQILGRMFLRLRLHTQARSDFFTLGMHFGVLDDFLERSPFLLGVESGDAARSVVGSELFADPAVLLPGNVAGGKM